MTEPITASTATPAGVVSALADLAAAYFDRIADGDWARASVVLSVFASTFNQHRDAVLVFIRTYSPNPDTSLVPARADATYSVSTRKALQVSLVLGPVGTRIVSIVESMPLMATPDAVAPFWAQLEPRCNAATVGFVADVARDPVRTLAQNLESRVDARVRGGGVATHTVDERVEDFDRPQTLAELLNPQPGSEANPIRLPDHRVGPTRWVMPTWGWWAIGLGVVAAGGVFAYGVIEKNWFGGA